MPPAHVKTIRELIYWEYAKLISDVPCLGIFEVWDAVQDGEPGGYPGIPIHVYFGGIIDYFLNI